MYGLVIVCGVVWWYGVESNYWGYNVIICICVFVDYVGLLVLLGCKLFGGYVFSYDFVEVVLMCCGGWVVYMVFYFGGSYEEGLLMLIDLLVCDCCWC